MPRVHQDFDRQKLYEEVWAEPVTKVSKRYGISDVGLRKICVGLDIPVPPVGHWAKLAAGKTVEKPALPASKGATSYRRTVYRDERDDDLARRAQARIDEDEADAPQVPAVELRKSIEECLPLVRRIEKKLSGKPRDSRDWPYCDGAGLMRIAVSPQNVQRVLLLLNLLFETLSAAGYRLSQGDKESQPAHVTILDAKLTFRVRERARQETVPLTQEQQAENKRLRYGHHRPGCFFHPTNELELAAFTVDSKYATATLTDTRSASLETKIQAFVVKLRHLTIRNSVRAEMAREQQALFAAQAVERAKRAEIRRRAVEQLKRVESWAVKLERANRLRVLANEFDTKKLKSSDDIVDAAWIRRAADWLDPTIECRWDDVDNAPPLYGEE
ncbi:hypothetical protein [Paraburkholderia domus]|uniref:hypothetical protein n=1 Tax=Paraburkholderia domus TaxID=2793075 RepID=UPI001B2F6384|nr:hypothetical protein [Paraburkholderia domus]CAE6695808.1 hypothetical protein R75483_00585 [Paraburkholderia domus]